MKDATLLIYQALNNNEMLINLLGGKKQVKDQNWNRIYNSLRAPYSEELPRITMFEVTNSDDVYGDDEPQCSDVNVRVDVWLCDDVNLFVISKEIKKTLLNNFGACNVRLESTMYESDTGIYHKPINVYLLLEQESE